MKTSSSKAPKIQQAVKLEWLYTHSLHYAFNTSSADVWEEVSTALKWSKLLYTQRNRRLNLEKDFSVYIKHLKCIISYWERRETQKNIKYLISIFVLFSIQIMKHPTLLCIFVFGSVLFDLFGDLIYIFVQKLMVMLYLYVSGYWKNWWIKTNMEIFFKQDQFT